MQSGHIVGRVRLLARLDGVFTCRGRLGGRMECGQRLGGRLAIHGLLRGSNMSSSPRVAGTVRMR